MQSDLIEGVCECVWVGREILGAGLAGGELQHTHICQSKSHDHASCT